MPHIHINNVSLEYPIYNANSGSLRRKLVNLSTGGLIATDVKDKTVVKALSNIDLKINAGDRLGLLGHNGSGKTTLLRCISGIYLPTSGHIDCEGSIAPLLEIGAGIEPELSGRANIRRMLLLYGTNTKKITGMTEEIEAFSELGDFLSLPVRTYSSGMMMRLMFAVATAATSDILVMDEFFSVGDAAFRQKAEDHIVNRIENASILVFASHSEALLKKLCNRFARLNHGQLEEITL